MDFNKSGFNISCWLENYITDSNRETPLVILSYAVSLDGCIASEKGKPYPVSCRQSEAAAHEIRSYCDAILVGIGTVLSDNPRLNVRHLKGDDPVPVVIDPSLRTPSDAAFLKGGKTPLIFCSEKIDSAKKRYLEEAGAIIEICRSDNGVISLENILKSLFRRGLKSLMVEGGGEVLSSFIRENLWDRMAVTVSPLILGGYNFYSSTGIDIRFKNSSWMNAGEDCICLIDRSEE